MTTKPKCVIVLPVSAHHAARLDSVLEDVPRSGPYHVTLTYLPNQGRADVGDKLLTAVKNAVDKSSPLVLSHENLLSFEDHGDGFPAIVAVRAASPAEPTALHDLKALIDHELKELGVEYSQKWPVFKPHITIGYTDVPVVPAKCWHAWVPSAVEIWYGLDASEGKDSVHLPLGRFYRLTD